MTSPAAVLKSVGPKLVPFFKTTAIYFVLYLQTPSLTATVFKCLPVISLAAFVLMHGISLGHQHAFSRRILAGLILSCIGDACLVWPGYFIHGMAAFGLAQICYCTAFGFRPLNLPAGAILYLISAAGLMLLLPGVAHKPALLVGLPIYSVLLTTTTWRAIARVQLFEDLWTWTKLCSCAGSISFLISDMIIGFDRFYSHIPNAQVFIMLTYYAAQLGIALSVVDSCHPPVQHDRDQRSPSPIQLKADHYDPTTCHFPAEDSSVARPRAAVSKNQLSQY